MAAAKLAVLLFVLRIQIRRGHFFISFYFVPLDKTPPVTRDEEQLEPGGLIR